MTLAVGGTTWRQYLADREARRRKDPVPTFIAVEGVHGNLIFGHDPAVWTGFSGVHGIS